MQNRLIVLRIMSTVSLYPVLPKTANFTSLSFFVLCSLITLSTALSADSRLPTRANAATSGAANGILYSDHLRTAKESGRPLSFQGSFVVEKRRSFLSEVSGGFPKRLFGEIESLPLREWSLGYAFEDKRPAHRRALAESGWRLADWLAEESLTAATKGGRNSGLIRSLEFDLQSELGGRRAQVGLNVVGALRENENRDAMAWQLRGFKSSADGAGGNAGLIYRWLPHEKALTGANVFVDYETLDGNNFWRWSAGAEIRSAWADLFGNYYQGITDDIRSGDKWIYTADGYEAELNVHSPDLPWLVGEVAYYHWQGRRGDSDDKGLRFGVKINPWTGLELGAEYEKSDDDSEKEWSWRVRYAGKFGESDKQQYNGGGENYQPSDYFFAPAEREYGQRIRTVTLAADGNAAGSPPRLWGIAPSALPMTVHSGEGAVSLTIFGASDSGQRPYSLTLVRGEYGAKKISIVLPPLPYYSIPTEQTATIYHASGAAVSLVFPNSGATVEVTSTVIVASSPRDYFRLVDGGAQIVAGSGSLIVERGPSDSSDYRRNYQRFYAQSGSTLAFRRVAAENSRTAVYPRPEMIAEGIVWWNVVNGITTTLTLHSLQGNFELAQDSFLTAGSPPVMHRARGTAESIVAATLKGGGGGGAYRFIKREGELELDENSGAVLIPNGTTPTDGGRTLTLLAMVDDDGASGANANNGLTDSLTMGFTLVYRAIEPLALVDFDSRSRMVYGLLNEENGVRAAMTLTATGGAGTMDWRVVAGELGLEEVEGNSNKRRVYIPAGVAPAAGAGNLLTLSAVLTQPSSAGAFLSSLNFGLSVNYVGVERIAASFSPSGRAEQVSPSVYRLTALSGAPGDSGVVGAADGLLAAAVLNGATGGGGGYSYDKVGSGGLHFNPATRVVYIPENTLPSGQRIGLTMAINDSGAGAEATPPLSMTLFVVFNSVDAIELDFRRNNFSVVGAMTMHGLEGNALEVANVARLSASGGFGSLTISRDGGELGLRGTEVFIPSGHPPTGQVMELAVSADDAEDAKGITDVALATLTVRYMQVPSLRANYLRTNVGNGAAIPGAVIRETYTLGMAAAVANAFTVAKLSAAGGVGNYVYARQSGDSQLLLEGDNVLIAANTPPGGLNLELVVEVNDAGANAEVSPPIFSTLSVLYDTVAEIAAEVVDTRNNSAVIDADGGTVYFLSEGNSADEAFGSLRIFGGLGDEFSDYEVVASDEIGLTYSGGILSMTKCENPAAKSIRFVINDRNDPGGITSPLTLNFSAVSGADECLEEIDAGARLPDGTLTNAPLNVYALEGATAATAVATLSVTGGGGDWTWTKQGGELELRGGATAIIPSGTTPQNAPGRELVLVAVAEDENNRGGFLTTPATVSLTANYVAVPSVVLNLNYPASGNPIAGAETIYGFENSPQSGAFAAIETGGGAAGANVESVLDLGTTPSSFAIVGGNVNFTGTFPAFGSPKNITAIVSANDAYAGSDAVILANVGLTPATVQSATVRLIPLRRTLQEGENIEANAANSAVAVLSADRTEGNFTVYALAGNKEEGFVARVGAAALDNASAEGIAGLSLAPPTRFAGAGLLFELDGLNASVRISSEVIPSGQDLSLVLAYDDGGHEIADLTPPLLKTVHVRYESVAAFAPVFRNLENAAIADAATVYVAPGATAEARAAKLIKVGGADGAMEIAGQSGGLLLKNNFDVVIPENTPANSTLVLTATVNDASGAAGSVTPAAVLELTVAYLETQNIAAELRTIAGSGREFGIAALDGTQTLFLDSARPRTKLDVLRLDISGGTGEYIFDTSASGLGLSGFELNANINALLLLDSVADGAKAYATVKIDDTGDGADISDSLTLTATVEVKLVTAVAANFVHPDSGDDITLRVISAESANSSSLHIANVIAENGTEDFRYTKQSGSPELSLTEDAGEVFLAANHPPDGLATLMLVAAVNDQGAGSTLTPEVLMTLHFVLAEKVGATAFLRGAFLPDGAGNDLEINGARTVRVKTADYGLELIAFGIRPSGGLGAPFAVRELGANGLSASDAAIEGYPIRVAVDAGLDAANAPSELAATLVMDDGNDADDRTAGATISLTLIYDKVEPVAGVLQDTDGNAIAGKHVVTRREGASASDLHVANIVGSGGVGNYTYRQVGAADDLIITSDGEAMVAANVVPAIGLELVATAAINDNGEWSHVSDEFLATVTVLYSSKVELAAVIIDTRPGAVPSEIPTSGGTAYFPSAGANENAVFGRLIFSGALPGDQTYNVVASQQNGIAYDTASRELSMTKCTDLPSADKSIRLVVNDSPDTHGVSDPLTVDIEVHSGAEECLEEIDAGVRLPDGTLTNAPLNVYALEGATAATAVATLSVSGGGGDWTWTKQGGELELRGGATAIIPSGTTPQNAPGRELVLVAVAEDENNRGGFLTRPATVSLTANYVAVPSVVLNLNYPASGNPIAGAETIYGFENSPQLGAFAAIETGGGAAGANVESVLDLGTTPNSFAIVGGNVNFTGTFPAFGSPKNITAIVSANDAYAGSDAVISGECRPDSGDGAKRDRPADSAAENFAGGRKY